MLWLVYEKRLYAIMHRICITLHIMYILLVKHIYHIFDFKTTDSGLILDGEWVNPHIYNE